MNFVKNAASNRAGGVCDYESICSDRVISDKISPERSC